MPITAWNSGRVRPLLFHIKPWCSLSLTPSHLLPSSTPSVPCCPPLHSLPSHCFPTGQACSVQTESCSVMVDSNQTIDSLTKTAWLGHVHLGLKRTHLYIAIFKLNVKQWKVLLLCLYECVITSYGLLRCPFPYHWMCVLVLYVWELLVCVKERESRQYSECVEEWCGNALAHITVVIQWAREDGRQWEEKREGENVERDGELMHCWN